MSGGSSCKCDERFKPIKDRAWVVIQRLCNFSAFNGYHWTPSDWSAIWCPRCQSMWRTKAKYVSLLPDGSI